MLSICDKFALNNDVRFNAMKSQCVIINPKRIRHCNLHQYVHNSNMRFQINGNNIEFVEHYKHLGHIINSAFDDSDDIADKRAAFIGQANNILCYFGKLSSEVKQHLFNSYCVRLVRPQDGLSILYARAQRETPSSDPPWQTTLTIILCQRSGGLACRCWFCGKMTTADEMNTLLNDKKLNLFTKPKNY